MKTSLTNLPSVPSYLMNTARFTLQLCSIGYSDIIVVMVKYWIIRLGIKCDKLYLLPSRNNLGIFCFSKRSRNREPALPHLRCLERITEYLNCDLEKDLLIQNVTFLSNQWKQDYAHCTVFSICYLLKYIDGITVIGVKTYRAEFR